MSSKDMGPFSEFSVVYTDRALNSMSPPFVSTMQSINQTLKNTYNADKVVLIPGSGTYSMEAVARQFVKKGDNKPVVVRNGWFSFRWTELFESMGIGEDEHVYHVADSEVCEKSGHTQYRPKDIDVVVKSIHAEKPPIVCAPHVETSTGIMLTDEYIKQLSAAAHEVGALFVLDGIASGTCWIDMKDLGVDVFISAPQKGWSGPAAVGLAMMSENAYEKMMSGPESTSFCVNLRKWSGMMQLYEGGGFGYHTTMPTDAIRAFDEIAEKQKEIGLDKLCEAQYKMGWDARRMLESKGLTSVAQYPYQAPGVNVFYSPEGNDNMTMVKKFKEVGMQIAAGVPWRIGEPDNLNTFRIGLFGIDKLTNVDKTVNTLENAIDYVMSDEAGKGDKKAA